jgi:hypothetical protein
MPTNTYGWVGFGWGYLAKKVPETATTTTPIVTAFKICISHRKNGLLNRLPEKVSFLNFFTSLGRWRYKGKAPNKTRSGSLSAKLFILCESRPGYLGTTWSIA